VRTAERKNQKPPAGVVFPLSRRSRTLRIWECLGIPERCFPLSTKARDSTRNGSWNRTVPVGARIMVTFVNHNGTVTQRPFAEGWLNEGWLTKVGAYFGRPVDVQQLRDGSLLVSDDFAGAVYRVTYQGS
jgi:hypothetical protein